MGDEREHFVLSYQLSLITYHLFSTMLHCPKCGRTYETDTQKFCTHDGGRLATGELSPGNQVPSNQAPTAYDLNQTVLNDPFDPEATVLRPDLNKTVTSLPTSEIRPRGTGPTPQQPPPAPSQPEPPAQPPVRESQPTVAFNQPPAIQPPPPQQQQQYYQTPQPPAPTISAPMPPPVAPPRQQQQQPQQQQQYAPAQYQQPAPSAPAPANKTSRAPLIIAIVALVLLGGAAAWYFLIYKKGEATASNNTNVANANTSANANTGDNSNASANANTSTTPPPPPPNATQFTNSSAGLDGKLAENYSDFSFYYPNTWEKDPKMGVAGASNFVQVERRLPPDFTQENFAVSWYKSSGTFETDSEGLFTQAVALAKEKFSKTLPEFEVVSEGETTINGIKGYEFRFQGEAKETEKGDVKFWGRVVFLPPGVAGKTNGIQLLMLTTSLAPELASADDIGVKGELPVILDSFRMGSK